MKKILVLLLFIFSVRSLIAQELEPKEPESMYKVNSYVSIPIALAGLGLNTWGLRILAHKDEIPESILLGLNRNDVSRFDRGALKQNADNRTQAKKISDIALYSTLALPAFLLFDKQIRKDWWQVYQLYFEAQGIGSVLYSWGAPRFINRYRPVTYYTEVGLAEREEGGNRNSFFSGHVSTSATGSFFMARIYLDYHPEPGFKRWLIYGAAFVPPTIVGVYRYKALKHFPTDVITGMFVGAAVGILIPHFHRGKTRAIGVSVIYNNQVKGLVMNCRF